MACSEAHGCESLNWYAQMRWLSLALEKELCIFWRRIILFRSILDNWFSFMPLESADLTEPAAEVPVWQLFKVCVPPKDCKRDFVGELALHLLVTSSLQQLINLFIIIFGVFDPIRNFGYTLLSFLLVLRTRLSMRNRLLVFKHSRYLNRFNRLLRIVFNFNSVNSHMDHVHSDRRKFFKVDCSRDDSLAQMNGL